MRCLGPRIDKMWDNSPANTGWFYFLHQHFMVTLRLSVRLDGVWMSRNRWRSPCSGVWETLSSRNKWRSLCLAVWETLSRMTDDGHCARAYGRLWAVGADDGCSVSIWTNLQLTNGDVHFKPWTIIANERSSSADVRQLFEWSAVSTELQPNRYEHTLSKS